MMTLADGLIVLSFMLFLISFIYVSLFAIRSPGWCIVAVFTIIWAFVFCNKHNINATRCISLEKKLEQTKSTLKLFDDKRALEKINASIVELESDINYYKDHFNEKTWLTYQKINSQN